MKKNIPTYRDLEKRLAVAEPIVEALKRHEVDAVVGGEKITFLLLREVGEALVKSDAEFRALFELNGVGTVQADSPSFRFTRVNQKFCEMTGYTSEKLLTKTLIELTDPKDHLRAMKSMAHMLRGKDDTWVIEKRCVRKDGSVFRVEVHGTALRDDTGRVVRIMAMIRDLTASSQAEKSRGVPRGKSATAKKKSTAKKPPKSAGRERAP